MNRVVTTVVGTLVESWQELRVHRGRVVLSLVGVTIAVASLAVVVGFGSLAERVTAAFNEQYGGRPATYSITGTSTSGDGTGAAAPATADAVDRELRAAAERYDVRYATEATYTSRRIQFPDGVAEVQGMTVDPPWAEMHRLRMASGKWFAESDRDRLAPAIVVNQAFLDRLGGADVVTHPTVRLPGAPGVTAVVVGSYVSAEWDTDPMFYQLSNSVATSSVAPGSDDGNQRTFEVWIPESGAKALANRIASDAERAVGGDVSVDASRMDAAGSVEGDPLGAMRYVIAGVAVLVLVLGGLGLLNVSLVSVRQRIREIGIRRGVGASAGRIFVAVLLENVLGTLVAGAVGVMLGAAVLGNATVRGLVTSGVEVGGAPFPLEAALVGVGSAVFVGALAGFLPAILAVRVKVIDAIRY
ncbi:ABC transporter permease [Curtobacterium pusillum]|uniref:ABC transporter permease n=1 Tax=Curtobacterium pusillum TaxID=69373 RepID=A0ABX2M9Y7_9MICO|nr:ABC transporter permease [Curtobacterium pusillum]NUU13700.1 ABC transporter permease [Curtobacterium pusillum]GLK30716.1 multidrug ABC transporter substrate-binding protein [Curtobacterium pusillum]